MRTLLPAVALLYGCAETCPGPQEINNRTFDMFTNATTWSLTNEEAFVSVQSPANGFSTYSFSWGTQLVGATMAVIIDGQEFAGTGTWDDQECGNFAATWSGLYTSEVGSEHEFQAAARFRWWDDGVNHLEGSLEWGESWRSPDGQIGILDIEDAQMRGDQL